MPLLKFTLMFMNGLRNYISFIILHYLYHLYVNFIKQVILIANKFISNFPVPFLSCLIICSLEPIPHLFFLNILLIQSLHRVQ